jgi:hypothetical protein
MNCGQALERCSLVVGEDGSPEVVAAVDSGASATEAIYSLGGSHQ